MHIEGLLPLRRPLTLRLEALSVLLNKLQLISKQVIDLDHSSLTWRMMWAKWITLRWIEDDLACTFWALGLTWVTCCKPLLPFELRWASQVGQISFLALVCGWELRLVEICCIVGARGWHPVASCGIELRPLSRRRNCQILRSTATSWIPTDLLPFCLAALLPCLLAALAALATLLSG